MLGRWCAAGAVSECSINARPIAGGKSPHVGSVPGEPAWVRDAIITLSERCPAAVLKISNPLPAHVLIGDVPQINPTGRILMPEKRGKGHKTSAVMRFPFIRAGPFLPACRFQSLQRAQSENVKKRTFIIPSPASVD